MFDKCILVKFHMKKVFGNPYYIQRAENEDLTEVDDNGNKSFYRNIAFIDFNVRWNEFRQKTILQMSEVTSRLQVKTNRSQHPIIIITVTQQSLG